MLRRGDILVERLTGKRAMVVDVPSPDEVTCRFADGRLEDRFTFEVDAQPRSFLDSLLSFVKFAGVGNPTERPPVNVTTTARPRLARQSGSS